tara:strand:+ start:2210 stop:2845 length:636 start_codon:yes stop_codon:yes gene_type:complete
MKNFLWIPFFVFFSILSFILFSQSFANERDKTRWNSKYQEETYLFGKFPIKFLYDYVHLLPIGRALDVAMGEGRNGVFLSLKGFDVVGVDISEEGLRKAQKLAKENNVKIETRVVDLENARFEKNAYEAVICSYYMQRDLFPKMKAALKRGGMILVETYNQDYLKYNSRFKPQWALEENELLKLLHDFKIIRYQAVDDGKLAYSSILAQKP